MAASTTDLITKVSSGTRLAVAKLVALKPAGTLTASCDTLNGWTTDTKVHFVIYNIDTQGKKVAGSQTDWSGIVSGTTITGMVLRAGTDAGYGVGAVVEASPTGAWADDLASGLGVTLNPDGSFKQGVVSATAISASAITLGYAQITSVFASTGTSHIQITGLTTTVTIPAGGRRIKVTGYAPYLQGSAAGNYSIGIWDGVVGTGTLVQESTFTASGAGSVTPITSLAILSPAAGSKTYNLSVKANQGTGSVGGAATGPAFILVEAI